MNPKRTLGGARVATAGPPADQLFVRGDANADPVYTLFWLFLGAKREELRARRIPEGLDGKTAHPLHRDVCGSALHVLRVPLHRAAGT